MRCSANYNCSFCRDRTVIIWCHWSPLEQLIGSQCCQVEVEEEKEERFFSLSGAKAFDVYVLYSLLYVEKKLVIIGIIFIS